MEILDRLTKLADKQKFTAKEREEIVKLAAKHGIEINPLCPDCYRDAVIQLYSIYKPKDEPQDKGGFILRDGLDVVLHARNGNDYHICEATLTKASALKWLANGAPSTIFAKMPKDED